MMGVEEDRGVSHLGLFVRKGSSLCFVCQIQSSFSLSFARFGPFLSELDIYQDNREISPPPSSHAYGRGWVLCWRISLESDQRKISRKFSIKGEEEGNCLVSINIGG